MSETGQEAASQAGRAGSAALADIDPEIAEFMSDPRVYRMREELDVKRVDTHAAVVFLAGRYAFKIKKPVDLGYLDFSTLEKRKAALEKELTLNQRTAPHIYHHVRPITRDRDGDLRIGGDSADAVEWALEMARFDESRVLGAMARRGSLPSAIAADAANRAAELHVMAERVHDAGGAEGIARVLEINETALRDLSPEIFKTTEVEEYSLRSKDRFEELKGLLDARRDAGLVRFGHGDLHLGNIFEEDGKAVIFDCLEFDENLAKTDVLYDFAYLLMDLKERGLDMAAARAFNAYFEAMPHDDWKANLEGLGALPFFMALRAAVRAHVLGRQAAQMVDELGGGVKRADLEERANRYMRDAIRNLDQSRPLLVGIGGLSGTGKSTTSLLLAPSVGRPVGALLMRSDVIRKRIMNAPLTEKLGPQGYTAEVNAKVYEAMFEGAKTALKSGIPVILDAVFARQEQRAMAETCAKEAGVRFKGFWLMAKEGVLKVRLHARKGDASDATADVLEEQLGYNLGDIMWTKLVTTETSAEDVVAAIRRVLPQ